MQSNEATINAVVDIGICGNNVVEANEDCEGADLAGHTCVDLGFSGGTLSCDIACSFDTSKCFTSVGGAVNPSTIILPSNVPFDLSSLRSLDITLQIASINTQISRLITGMPQAEESKSAKDYERTSWATCPIIKLVSPVNEQSDEARFNQCSCTIAIFFIIFSLILLLIWLFKRKY